MPNHTAAIRAKVQAAHPGAVVVGRTPNGIKHQLPDGSFHVSTGVGPGFHHSGDVEIDTDWVPGTAPWDWESASTEHKREVHTNFADGQNVRWTDVSGETVTLKALNLQWTNDLDQIQFISAPQAVNGAPQDNNFEWAGAYGAGLDFEWLNHPQKLIKHLVIQSAAALPAYTLGGTGAALELQVQFGISNGVEVWVNGALWTTGSGNAPDVDTQGQVQFRSKSTGQVLWVFDYPRSEDSSTSERHIGKFRLKKQGPNLNIWHRVEKSWLDTATYPVRVDTDVSSGVAASGDDGHANLYTFDGTNTTWPLGNYLIAMTGANARFPSVNVPNAATITAADVDMKARSSNSSTTVNVTIYAIDEDNHTAPTTLSEFNTDHSTHTTASVNWNNISAWTSNVTYTSPDITSVIQEIVDRAGWAANQAMGLHFDENSSSSHRSADSYDGSDGITTLNITYSAGGGGADSYLSLLGVG